MNKLDMGFGNPSFLQDYWKKYLYSVNNYDLSYKNHGQEFLKNKIKDIHKHQENADVTDKYIVIGNGASQIIQAIIAVLNQPVYASPPYFTRFPIFSKNVGQKFKKTINPKKSYTQIITIPNNPDNKKIIDIKCKNVIFDLTYNWQQYTNTHKFNANIMVFSLAKATGHASTRVGWGIFSDRKLAKQVEEWIETNTSGVSYEAQMSAYKVLNSQLKKNNLFKYGKRVLDNRWKEINKRKFPFKILNNSGMFAWIKGKAPKEIIYIKGSDLGVSDDHFRVNIGCDNKTFRKFLKYGKLKTKN